MDARALHASLKKARDGPSKSHGVPSCVVKRSRWVEFNEGDAFTFGMAVQFMIFFVRN